ERAHAVGEDRARDPWQAALELVEAARATEHLAHDQKRPTVAEDLGGLDNRAVLRVAAHRATMLAADWPTGLLLEPVGSKVELGSPGPASLRCSHGYPDADIRGGLNDRYPDTTGKVGG